MSKLALVTGANRGIGKKTAEELAVDDYIVYCGVRNFSSISQEHNCSGQLNFIELDVTSTASINNCVEEIISKHGRIDVLVNNAGVYPDDTRLLGETSMLDIDPDLFSLAMKVNVEGPLRLIWKILPFMKKHNFGRIVNVSSGMGRLEDFDRQAPFYRISKSALNSLTVIVSKEVKDYNVLVNSVCPGWVNTDMGGQNAPRSIAEGAKGILEAIKYPENGPNGMFLRDGKPLDWYKKY